MAMTVAVWRWFHTLRLFPWREHSREVAADTTPGGEETVHWATVYVAANRTEAEIIRSHLMAEEIPAVLQGEALGQVYGLTMGPLAKVNVLVPEEWLEQARKVLGGEGGAPGAPEGREA